MARDYVGCLLFDNDLMCEQVAKRLESCRGQSMATIGSSSLLPAAEPDWAQSEPIRVLSF
jgi:hypothetical protein